MADRETAIKHLTECVEYLDGDSTKRLWVFVRGDVVRAALKLLKAQEPGWISVKDMLPKNMEPRDGEEFKISKTVLVCITYGYGLAEIDQSQYSRYGSGHWIIEYNEPGVKVTHWMPLPEMPEGEEG